VKACGIAPARHRSRSGEAGGSLYLFYFASEMKLTLSAITVKKQMRLKLNPPRQSRLTFLRDFAFFQNYPAISEIVLLYMAETAAMSGKIVCDRMA